MANVILSDDAKANIKEILSNVVEFTGYQASGDKLLAEFEKSFARLSLFPLSGRMREDTTREIFVKGYRIVYTVLGDNIYVLAAIHSRRLYPRP